MIAYISLKDFHLPIQDGLRHFCEDTWGDQEYLIDGVQHWAWLYFCLKEAEYNKEWFPLGKWNTLNDLSDRLGEVVKQRLAKPV